MTLRLGLGGVVTFLALPCEFAYAIQLGQLVSESGQCPPGSEIYSVPTSVVDPQSGYSRVAMADYPSAGSTWLKQLLTAAAEEEHLGSPACTIYGNEPSVKKIDDGLFCPENWTSSMGSALVKSHFPAQEVYSSDSIVDGQMNATMKFDKLLMLVRHPVALVNSNVHRWGGSTGKQAENLECWGQWWKRVADTVGAQKVHIAHYEDLCANTAEILLAVMEFMGGRYAEISQASVQRMLERRRDLACIHADSIDSMSAITTDSDAEIVSVLKTLMPGWGYQSEDEALRELPKVVKTRESGKLLPASSDYENPWASVWKV